MSKVLILGPVETDSTGLLRMQIWLRTLLEAGHEVFAISRHSWLEPVEEGPHFEIDLDHVEGLILEEDQDLKEAWREAAEEFEPEIVAAVGLRAAAELVGFGLEDQAMWFDCFEKVEVLGDASGEALEWWKISSLLDRVDLITCARPDLLSPAVGLLGLRGRFDLESAATALVQSAWLPPTTSFPPEIHPELHHWWNEAKRAPTIYEPTARREKWMHGHAAHLTHELNLIRGSKMWKLWMWTIRIRSVFWRPFGWVAGILFMLLAKASGLVRRGYLVFATGRRICAAQLRRMFRSQKLVSREPSAPPSRRPRLLIVMPYPIFPANHGGARRLSNLIRRLSEGCDLYLIVFIRTKDDPLQREALEPFVEKLWFHHWHPAIDKRKDLRPPNVRLFEDPAASLLIRDVVETHRIDVVQLEYTEMAQYRHAVGDVPVILVEHDVAFRSLRRRRSLGFGQRFPESRAFGASWLDWMALMRYEVRACRSVDQLHMMSADDAGYLARFLQDGARRMYVVPNAVDTEHYRPTDSMPKRMGVLMVGNYQNLPNLDAFEYLVEEIWPRVRELRPDAELSVVGAKMPDHLHDWDGKDGVTVVGEVESIRAEYHKHAVLVVPLRAGSGTRLKLFEAFASGIPSVSTTIGAEGIACRHDEHVLIADDAASIAREIDRLLGDQELADRVADNALRLVEERYDWSAAAAVNLSGVHELMRPEPAPQVAATPITDPEPRPFGRSPAGAIAVSVIIPTYRGGELLERCLEGISRQQCSRPFEVVCVDSGSPESDLGVMRRLGARVHGIDKRFFNHGLTRDLGARLAAGEVLVYINQDVIAADDSWLEEITKPLFAEDPPAAVQGAMAEFPHHTSPVRRFFWDSCGERFYFTRESDRWIRRFEGVGFSTVNAALRRDAWEQIPFGWAPFMEDKKWQRQAMQAGLKIVDAHKARVYHTHDYDVRSLLRRCQSEGFGWRLLGEHYTFGDMLRDLWAPRQWKELLRGLIRQGREMKTAEIFFPWLRPVAVWYGNKRLQDVKH